PIYKEQNQRTELPVVLPPYGSTFVVFKKGVSKPKFLSVSSTGQHPPLMEFTQDGILFLEPGTYALNASGPPERVVNAPKVHPLTGPWNVSFPDGWAAPSSVTFPDLISWSQAENTGVKYFS